MSTQVDDRTFENALTYKRDLFSITRIVTLGKTSAQGGAYFVSFFEWMGEAREELLLQTATLAGAALHTSSASVKFLRELGAFDQCEVMVWPRAKRMSVQLRFFFLREHELIAVGDQEICLKRNGSLSAITETISAAISSYDPLSSNRNRS